MKKLMMFVAIFALVASTGCESITPKPEEKPGSQPAENNGGGGGGVDPTTFVKAPGKIYVKWTDPKVGYMIMEESVAGGQTNMSQWAIVAETDDVWHVEYSGPEITAMAGSFPALKGQLMGLVVNKSDMTVAKAMLGKPGEECKEIQINPVPEMPAPAEAAKPEMKETSVKVAAGEFKANMTDVNGVKSWVGMEGDVKNVLLKIESENANYELKMAPAKETLDVGGVSVDVVKVVYSNGSEQWYTGNEVVKCFKGSGINGWAMFANVAESFSMKVTGLKTDAKAELMWK